MSLTAPQSPTAVTHDTISKSTETVLYLAYGSNLCAETFQGKRGIKPIAAVNVVVPSLDLVFDLPGLPYTEPCFANSRHRNPDSPSPPPPPASVSEKSTTPLLSSTGRGRWQKGLVGVVYEVTGSDFVHIIATEGAGASYQDISVPCYVLAPDTLSVPDTPQSPHFLAHTLCSPNRTLSRPNPDYAQPSVRYLKLLNDGAVEHKFPKDYQVYLRSLHGYHLTGKRQKIGRLLFFALWGPLLGSMFFLMRKYTNKKGRSPPWVVWLLGKFFESMWMCYDGVFKGVFGDGERTIGDDERWDRKVD